MGCRLTDNAKAGAYDGHDEIVENLCSGICDGCPHYYSKDDEIPLRSLLMTIRNESQPIEGHDDPGALDDCWNEVFRRIQS